MTLHFIMVFQNRKNPEKVTVDSHNLSVENITDTMTAIKAIIEVTCKSWHKEWQLIAVSHTFLP